MDQLYDGNIQYLFLFCLSAQTHEKNFWRVNQNTQKNAQKEFFGAQISVHKLRNYYDD